MEFQLQPQSFQGISCFKQRIYTIFKIFIKNGEKSVSVSFVSVKRCFPDSFLYVSNEGARPALITSLTRQRRRWGRGYKDTQVLLRWARPVGAEDRGCRSGQGVWKLPGCHCTGWEGADWGVFASPQCRLKKRHNLRAASSVSFAAEWGLQPGGSISELRETAPKRQWGRSVGGSDEERVEYH